MRIRLESGGRRRCAAIVLASLLTTGGAGWAKSEAGESVGGVEPRVTGLAGAGGPELSAAPESMTARDASGVPPEAASPADEPVSLAITRPGTGAEGLPAVGAAPRRNRAMHYGGESSVSDADFDYASLPGRLSEPRLRPLWSQGLALEREERLLESAQRYELIVGEVPEESFTYWRIARNYWRHGESLPTEEKVQRVHYFELSEDWAARGISIDPECAPCMLWKFVSMGRQATTRGLITAAGDVREMGQLLTTGIELRPEHADDPGNSTLGNLYYSGAVFYRVIPDWWWLSWVVGVRGDKERSLDYAERAVEIAEMRVDYRVELGAALLCLGTDRGDTGKIARGVAVLAAAQGLDDYLSTDHLDKQHAAVLIDSPEKACGYSRDGFIDLDEQLNESELKP